MRSHALRFAALFLAACGGDTFVLDAGADGGGDGATDALVDAPRDGAACGQSGVSFACGAATCTDAQPVCCTYANLPARCVASAGATCFVDGGVPRMQTTQCDDANDCGGAGHACYRSYNKGTSQIDYLCDSTAPGATQVCKQSCECLGGKSCVSGTCQ
jgi:hypothetical protein